jgi:hypothetical protein
MGFAGRYQNSRETPPRYSSSDLSPPRAIDPTSSSFAINEPRPANLQNPFQLTSTPQISQESNQGVITRRGAGKVGKSYFIFSHEQSTTSATIVKSKIESIAKGCRWSCRKSAHVKISQRKKELEKRRNQYNGQQ